LKHLLLLAIAILSLAPTGALAGHNRTIYYNGKVFTANSDHLWAEGVVVEGAVILAVATTEEVLQYKEDDSTLVDLTGKTMIPGFNDAHVHPFDATSFPRAVRLNSPAEFVPGPGPTLQEVVDLVARGAAKTPAGTWLMVSIGTNVVEDAKANRFALQDAAPNHPVLLATWYGHGTILNTRAMEVIGIGEEEPDPFGGVFDRLPNSSVITGVVREYAEHRIRRYFAEQMTDEEFKTLYEVFAMAAAERGYTSVQEFSVGVPQRRHLDLLAQSNIPIRWRAICFPLTVDESCETPAHFAPDKPLTTLTGSGIKWIVDGTFIERAALLSEDYADAPGIRGRLNFPTGALEIGLERSAFGPIAATQPLFHAVGDGTTDTILDSMGAVAPDGQWKARRPRLEHGTLLRPGRYESARQKGVFVVQNPLHFSLAPISSQRLAQGLLADIDPMRSLLDADVKLAIGSDSVGTPGNPFLDLFFALIQPTRPAEALTIEQAVIAYTRTAAEAEFQEHRKGTLEPGKTADLVVLSGDIFTLPPPAILTTRSLLTVVGGKVAFDAGALRGSAGAASNVAPEQSR
jgi:predicted amidohydrolase YtcJ